MAKQNQPKQKDLLWKNERFYDRQELQPHKITMLDNETIKHLKEKISHDIGIFSDYIEIYNGNNELQDNSQVKTIREGTILKVKINLEKDFGDTLKLRMVNMDSCSDETMKIMDIKKTDNVLTLKNKLRQLTNITINEGQYLSLYRFDEHKQLVELFELTEIQSTGLQSFSQVYFLVKNITDDVREKIGEGRITIKFSYQKDGDKNVECQFHQKQTFGDLRVEAARVTGYNIDSMTVIYGGHSISREEDNNTLFSKFIADHTTFNVMPNA